MIRVIIADDQNILAEGLKMILGKEKDIDICGIAQNGQETYNMCDAYKPEVILMDIKMPVMDGVESTKKIKEKYPNIKIIVLTTFKDDEYIYEALKNGASGYLLKDASPEEIAEAIRTVNDGGALIQSEVAARVIDKFSQMANNEEKNEHNPKLGLLTDREREICKLLAEGKNNKEISEELYLSEGTIKNHITKVLNKLELRDRTQLAIFSIKNNL